MLRKSKGGVEWLEFELLADIPKVKHGVFLRHGGVSSGAYSGLNLSVRVGDDPEAVSQNHKIVADILGVENLVWLQQQHGKEVVEIKSHSQPTGSGDALVSNSLDVGLMIGHADCQAGIIYDPIRHAAANVHSGWRGSVLNIYAETIAFMKMKYRSDPKDLLVCISPSLGPSDAQFINYRTELPEHFWKHQCAPNYFDFWAISTAQLMECGVLPEHIEVAGISTYSHPEDFFSYRRNPISGRNGTVIVLG